MVCFLVHVCSPANAQANDEGFRRCLIGSWIAAGFEKTFHDDGTATGALHLGGDPEKIVTFKSLWRVENGQVKGQVLESSDPDTLRPGTVFSDRIVSIKGTDFVFRNESGQYELRTRTTPPSPDCVADDQTKTNDVDVAAKIVGTWVAEYPDGVQMEKTYRPDATSSGTIIEKTLDGEHRTNFESRWQVKNGYFLGEVLTSDNPGLIGGKYTDKIITVTDQEFITIEDGAYEVTVKHRKQ